MRQNRLRIDLNSKEEAVPRYFATDCHFFDSFITELLRLRRLGLGTTFVIKNMRQIISPSFTNHSLFLADRSPTCGLPDQEGATLTDSIINHLDDIGEELRHRGDLRASKSFI